MSIMQEMVILFFGFHGNDLWRVVTGNSERLEVSNSGIIINDGGVDADFRVESNNNAAMLLVMVVMIG